MTLKLTLLFMMTVTGTLIGVGLSKRLTGRRRYFEELISLINTLISDFKFKQSSVGILLSNFKAAAVKPAVDEFIAYASGDVKELRLPRQELTEREYNFVTELFSALGTYDLDTQVFVLDNYKLKAEEFYATAKEQECRYGRTYVKLGFRTCGRNNIIIRSGQMDIGIIFRIAAVGILTAVVNQVLKKADKDEIATLTTLAGLVIVLLMVIDMIAQLFDTLKMLFTLY